MIFGECMTKHLLGAWSKGAGEEDDQEDNILYIAGWLPCLVWMCCLCTHYAAEQHKYNSNDIAGNQA